MNRIRRGLMRFCYYNRHMLNKIVLPHPYSEVPYLRGLAAKGIECDQLLAEAVRRASRNADWDDGELTIELAVLGSRTISALDIPAQVAERLAPDTYTFFDISRRKKKITNKYYNYYIGRSEGRDVLRSLQSTKGTLTANACLNHFVQEIFRTGDDYVSRPFTADLLAHLLTGQISSKLSDHPRLVKVVQKLPQLASCADDIEFILALDSAGRIRFRSTGHMGDCVQDAGSGLWVPNRAMLVHHQTFGSFTIEQIQELEDLINDPRAKEEKFQTFFERHPHFFRRWDHRAVHPHVYLTREEDADGPLIPDFILTNAEAQQAFVLDLKLPTEKVIRAQKNRDRFSAAVMEAKAQLETYRDWFEEKYNREKLKEKVGMAIYRPQLSVVIGRSSEFRDEIDRAKLRSREPGIEVVTYDDILAYAKKRQITLDGGTH